MIRTPLIEKILNTAETNKILVEKLLDGYEKGQAEGESIHITDSANLPMFLKPQGQVLQDTRDGYNILPITLESGIYNGLEVTVNEDKSITLNRTVTAPLQLNFFKGNMILNGEYTYYLFNKTNQVNIQSGDGDIGTILRFNDNFEKVTKTYDTDTVLTNLFTYVDNTKHFNNETFKFMLVKGSEEKEYEQYGQMPSTNFPSPIKKVEGDYNIRVNNRNLAKIETLDINWRLTESGITNLNRNAGVRLTEINLKKGEKFYINFKLLKIKTTTMENDMTFTGYINGVQTISLSFGNIQRNEINNTITKEYTANEDCTLSYILWGNVLSETFEFQFWITKEPDTDYIKVQQQNLPLTIPDEIKLYGENDGFVYLTEKQTTELELVDGEGWYVYNEWGEIVIVGTERFIEIESIRTPKTYVYQFDYTKLMSPTNNNVIGAKCNYFNENTANNIWSTKTDLEAFSLNINHTLHIRTEIAPDLFKTWLEEKNTEGNPLKVVGKLVNPTYTKITDKNFIKQLENLVKAFAYEGVTNIDAYSTDDKEKAPLIISAEYLKSQKLINKNLETRITALENALINNI